MKFYKYQGAGNDFVIIDDRKKEFPSADIKLINHLCDRRFGVGADGLMLLQEADGYDFRMVYFNADGNESTMCGNGGRCIVHFAKYLEIIENKSKFIAIDGEHLAEIEGDIVNLQMINVDLIESIEDDFWLDTGSPHYIRFVKNLSTYDVVAEGRKVRKSERFRAEGTNVNFIEEISGNHIAIRTYERGVEDETLACGTGVTAASIIYGRLNNSNQVKVKAIGGDLEVKFEQDGNNFSNVWLKGPAKLVFEGEI